jgi:hypothetical protein
MYKTISNEIIRKFQPCYDPSKFITDENEELIIKQWVEKYRKVVPTRDILWLLLRKEFMSKKDLILFVVWCAREALKLVENPDDRIVEACNVAERYANGEATKEELDASYIAADNVANAVYLSADAAYYAAIATDAGYYAATAADADYVTYYTASATLAAANAARDTANAARDTDNAVRAVANAAIVAYYAAIVAYYAAFAASDTVSRAAANVYAEAAADATRFSQIDQLLTYFE